LPLKYLAAFICIIFKKWSVLQYTLQIYFMTILYVRIVCSLLFLHFSKKYIKTSFNIKFFCFFFTISIFSILNGLMHICFPAAFYILRHLSLLHNWNTAVWCWILFLDAIDSNDLCIRHCGKYNKHTYTTVNNLWYWEKPLYKFFTNTLHKYLDVIVAYTSFI